jgi:hypothetical protein
MDLILLLLLSGARVFMRNWGKLMPEVTCGIITDWQGFIQPAGKENLAPERSS